MFVNGSLGEFLKSPTGLTCQSAIFQSVRDGATASCVLTSALGS